MIPFTVSAGDYEDPGKKCRETYPQNYATCSTLKDFSGNLMNFRDQYITTSPLDSSYGGVVGAIVRLLMRDGHTG